MRKLDSYLKNRRIIENKLVKFGFIKENDIYTYSRKILNDDFEIKIYYDKKDEKCSSKIFDLISDEEYTLVDIEDAVGEFVGTVKTVYEDVILDFVSKCSISEVFKSDIAKKVIEYIHIKYGDELEFLWEKFDDNAIWRNKQNNKWYFLIMTIPESKLGFNSDNIIEVINVMYQKGKTQEVVDNVAIYPGYHMNKNSWITIKLDGTAELEKIYKLIDNSYKLSVEKKG